MSDRSQAISILERAREILAARLAERVAEFGEEIIEDALGHTYTSEIEAIHDQLSVRLTHVNGMLANLPPVAEPPATLPYVAETSLGADAAGNSIVVSHLAAAPALPPAEGASFRTFISAVLAENHAEASNVLSELFNVDVDRARRCVATFASKLADEPGFLERAMKLRGELQGGTTNGSLLLLWECFGLQGLESLGVIEALRARLGAEESDLSSR